MNDSENQRRPKRSRMFAFGLGQNSRVGLRVRSPRGTPPGHLFAIQRDKAMERVNDLDIDHGGNSQSEAESLWNVSTSREINDLDAFEKSL